MRQCLIALRLAERLDLSEAERADLFYVSLLAWVGCTADAHTLASWFGDDIAFRAGSYDVDLAGIPLMGYALRRLGTGSPPLRRVRLAASFARHGPRALMASMVSHCEVASTFAERLGLGAGVAGPLKQAFARWDGKGAPSTLAGDDIAVAIRIVQLADVIEVHHRSEGIDAAIQVAQDRSSKQFDPSIVQRFCDDAPGILADLGPETSWDAVIEAEPGLHHVLSDAEFEGALEAFADFVDLKSPYTAGHSRGVADLAAAAARRYGLPEGDAVAIRRAGLVHDLGRLGIPNSIWDKPGPLSHAERERVRLHPYLTERMLSRPRALASIGGIASLHHERLDGSGYHRSLSAPMLAPAARIIAAADVYHAMTEPRPHRPAAPAAEIADALRAGARAGALDGQVVNAVLAAAGHRVPARAELPAGLTAREAEVLGILARGSSNREIARRLHIAEKTVGSHVEHIYAKIAVSTRAAASLFAMQHGLVDFAADR
ncbi:MAG: HD domain-containing phosphohydrolase [Actinomycetota bacterium]